MPVKPGICRQQRISLLDGLGDDADAMAAGHGGQSQFEHGGPLGSWSGYLRRCHSGKVKVRRQPALRAGCSGAVFLTLP